MPCPIQIKANLTQQVYDKGQPGLLMTLANANKLATEINTIYGAKVISFTKYTEDELERNITIPQSLIDTYYASELKKEIAELKEIERQAEELQRQDSIRAGIIDNVLEDEVFKKESDENFNQRTIENYFTDKVLEHRDLEIAEKLGEKYAKAFGIGYDIITPTDAAILLSESPTPYTNDVSAFYYNNRVYFIKGKFSASSVIHEFAHPLIKGIAIQNPKLFNSLFNQLTQSPTGLEAIKHVRNKYPELKEDTPRFKEEAIVTAMQFDADRELAGIVNNDSAFAKFIQNLLFALKQVLKALVGKVNLKNLSTSTTREELVDMMLNKDFFIEDLNVQLSLFAEFQKDTEDYLNELKKASPQKLIDVINQFHTEMAFQLGVLRNSPQKLKEDLKGKEGMDVLKNIRDYVKAYKTVGEDITEEELEELFKTLEIEQDDLRKRSLSFINSLTELEVFANRVKSIMAEMRATNKFMTYDGNAKIQYFKQFMEREITFLENVRESLALNPSDQIVKKILSLKAIVQDNINEAKNMTFDFVKGFFIENSLPMQKNVKEKFETFIDKALSVEKFTEQEIQAFKDDLFYKLDVQNIRSIATKDFLLPRPLKSSSLLLTELFNYNANKITEQSVDNYLRGHVKDVGMAGILTPMANINDMLGSFVSFMKDKLSEQEMKSLQAQYKMAEELQPYLAATGISHNDTSAIADIVLFKDIVPDRDKDGNLIETEIYAYLDKFKTWRFDKAKLEDDIVKAKEKGDKDEIKAALNARWEWEEKYMQKQHVDAVYAVKKMWRQDNVVFNPATKKDIVVSAQVSLDAYMERREALEDMSTFNNSVFTELDDLNEFTPSKAAKIKYDELYNMFNLNGQYKQGIELEKVLIRRAYREQSRKFSETTPNLDKVQRDFDHFVNVTLGAIGVTKESDPARYQAEIIKFRDKNFKVAYSDAYYQERSNTLERIKKLNEKSKDTAVSKQLANLYEQRYNLVNRVTDKDGEPNGLRLAPDQINRLKAIEEEIVEAQESFDRKSGLSKDDAAKFRYYEDLIGLGLMSEMTPEEQAEYKKLASEKTIFGLTSIETTQLRKEYKKLAELTNVECTEYYVTAFNNALGNLDLSPLTVDTADNWLKSADVAAARAASPEFAEWFDKNHYTRTGYDVETGESILKYFRLKAWNISKPADEGYYKHTILLDPITKEQIPFEGVPIAKYSVTKIKDEFFTGYNPKTKKVELKVGVHIDNRNSPLPIEYAIGHANDKYMNKQYYELKQKNNAQFLLLEKLKENYLKMQEDKQYPSKMYLDFARFRIKDNIEYLQKGKLKEDIKEKSSSIYINVRDSVKAASDDPENRFNFDNDLLLIPTDLQGNPISRVPVRGLFKLDINAVSTDVLRSQWNYMYSLDKQNTLIENESLAKAIQSVYADPDNALDKLDRASKTLSKINDKAAVFLKRSTNKRLQIFNDFMDRTFYGQVTSEFQSENVKITKVARGLMGQASRAFYALNPVSSLKNKWGMNYQRLVFAAGGKYIDFPSMARGQITATKAILEYAGQGAYARGMKSLNMQMVELFGMDPGKAEKDFGKSTTRTGVKDLIEGSWMYSDRRLLEKQGAFEIGFSILEKQMVDQIQPDGSVLQIRYANAFETAKDGSIKLKDGINPEWGTVPVDHVLVKGDTLDSIAKQYNMTVEELKLKNKITSLTGTEIGDSLVIARSTELNKIKRVMASSNKRLNGTTTDLDSPAAEKYLLYNLFSFSRKYATGMFLERFQMDTSKENFGGDTWDWDLNESKRGSYIQFLQSSWKLITKYNTYAPLMTDEEKSVMKKVFTEGMLLVLLGVIITYIFGYSVGDEDRFKKIKEREEKYGRAGWMANHLLYQLMMVKKENQSFIPLPFVGLNEWTKFTETSTIVVSPTLGVYGKILQDLGYMATGSDKALYKQDVGPYSWQEEGNYKIYNHLGALIGLSGKNAAPYWAIKKKEISEALM